jgi:exodeoxyribonuclease (lambda-induced)
MIEQRSPEWFAARKGRITASVCGAILGLNHWMSPDDLMRQMVREWHGAEREFKGNAATEYGAFHEDGAITQYEMETGQSVEQCGFYTHDELLGASPDGLLDNGGLIEVKCPYGLRDNKYPQFKTPEQQPHYYAQMQIEMLCANRIWCHFYQWAPHATRLDTVFMDDEWLIHNVPVLRKFYDQFLEERKPENSAKYLEDKVQEVDTLRAKKLAAEYLEICEAIKLAEQRKKDVLSELVAICEERNSVINGHKLTKVKRAGSVSYAKVVKDHLPMLDLAPYTGKETEYWRLS